MAGLLYLGTGMGMLLLALLRRAGGRQSRESRLTRAELPYTLAMILLDILAPICLLFGLRATTAANASLLNNFEIVATALIALLVFRERIGLCTGERIAALWSIPLVLAVGLVAYGLSIYFYVYAQRLLGAARTSAYYAVSPFLAALLSLILFQQIPDPLYFAALGFMILGDWLSAQGGPLLPRRRSKQR